MAPINFSDFTSFKYNNIVLGATAVIGVLGGIYLLSQSTKPVRSRIAERRSPKTKKDEEQFCNICFAPLDIDDPKAYITCCSCAKLVCSDEKCFGYEPNDGELRCRLCRAKRDSYGKTSSWVAEQSSVQKIIPAHAYPMRAKSEIYIPMCDPNDSAFLCNFESVSEAPSSINVNQKQQIRECIEEILAEMLGGPLDSTSVGPMSRSKHYTSATNGAGNNLQGVSHIRLRRLIESIIAETIRGAPFLPSGPVTTTEGATEVNGSLPNPDELILNGTHCNGNAGQYFAPKKYQDLLATAVLNKIVDTHGNGRHSESSPDLTNTSAFDKNHNALFPNKTDESISSGSSFEPRSDSSLTDPLNDINKGDDVSSLGSCRNFIADVTNQNVECDNESVLSDFIASHMVPLPNISAEPESEEEEEDEDFVSVGSSGRDSNWGDNWFFRKKKGGKKASSIGMLVPAPKEDIRALIGDKPTDEISDLSEIGSDTDDSSLEMTSAHVEPFNDRFINQHLIGGKNTKLILDELVERSSLISTSSLPENVPPYTETKNDFVIDDNGFNDTDSPKISLKNCNLTINKEAINSNVTKIISAAQKKVEPNVPSPPPSDQAQDEKMRYLMASKNEDKLDSGDENSPSMSPRSSASGPLSGSIAEREYKKWYNAVDMPNNPYSVEALKRRLSGGPEKIIDLPSISPSTEEKPIMLGQGESKENAQERDYARYSRDYYINDAKNANGGPALKKNIASATTPSTERPSPSPLTAPLPQQSSIAPSSSVELEESSDESVQIRHISPVKAMCHKLERQCRGEAESGIYAAIPARVEEDTSQEPKPLEENIVPLTTEAVSKLSTDSGSGPATESLTPSEDSDTIRIYDLKKQETRLIRDKENKTSVPKTPTKKNRPTELDIPPLVGPSTSKCTTPSSFKFLQPKRKLIEPSQVLATDLDSNPVSPIITEKSVIEEDVVQSLPSVKALAKAFLLTSATTRMATDKWHKVSNANRLQGPEAGISSSVIKGRTKSPTLTPFKATPSTPAATVIIQKSPEPAVADTTSQGSEDATIASDLSSLETDPPSKQETDVSDPTPTQDRPLSPIVVPGCLKSNIAFFENLKNK